MSTAVADIKVIHACICGQLEVHRPSPTVVRLVSGNSRCDYLGNVHCVDCDSIPGPIPGNDDTSR